MNIKDRVMEFLLAVFDHFMDWRSRGRWTEIRGSEILNIVNVSESKPE